MLWAWNERVSFERKGEEHVSRNKTIDFKKIRRRLLSWCRWRIHPKNEVERFLLETLRLSGDPAYGRRLAFDAASLTKVIATTSLVLRLWEDGKIELDRPLADYLPAFDNQTITIRHLLTHTSDIQTWIPDRDQLSQEELIAAYLKLQPGRSVGKGCEIH